MLFVLILNGPGDDQAGNGWTGWLDGAKKIIALFSDSFTDTLHDLLQAYGEDSVTEGVIIWRRKNDNGTHTIFRNYFGNGLMCMGLTRLLDEKIAEDEFA